MIEGDSVLCKEWLKPKRIFTVRQGMKRSIYILQKFSLTSDVHYRQFYFQEYISDGYTRYHISLYNLQGA